MATRRRRSPAPPRSVLLPPREHCWIESDAYDRSAFATLLADTPSLAAVAEAGGALVPHFAALLEDLFCLLFKLEPRWRGADEVAPAAALGRALLASLREHPLLEHLRTETTLDEVRAGLATVLLGEHVARLLREEDLLPRGDLLDLWEVARDEDVLRDRAAELDDMRRLADDGDPAARRAADEAEHAAVVAEARLRGKARNVGARLAEMPTRARDALPAGAAAAIRHVAEAGCETRSWGTGLGAGGRLSPGRQIELGRRLATNPKLKQLGALVGRMRAHAKALRQKTFERVSEEIHAVEWGADLAHLLPPELLALRHPVLRRDLLRRLVEGRLLSYQLRGTDERGRGPMIVCLDGSGSMAGEKEIWSKAVALTLLEIARRQRRLFRFICFSSAETPLFTLDLNPRDHHAVRMDRALDVAEYFPGGGTDFATPLDAALDGLRTARYRRGDVVLITDGACEVSPAWRTRFLAEKSRLGFSLFSVLIDVGQSTVATLEALSDRVTSVSQLTDDAARDLFLHVR